MSPKYYPQAGLYCRAARPWRARAAGSPADQVRGRASAAATRPGGSAWRTGALSLHAMPWSDRCTRRYGPGARARGTGDGVAPLTGPRTGPLADITRLLHPYIGSHRGSNGLTGTFVGPHRGPHRDGGQHGAPRAHSAAGRTGRAAPSRTHARTHVARTLRRNWPGPAQRQRPAACARRVRADGPGPASDPP